jgi:hypothetical protein
MSLSLFLYSLAFNHKKKGSIKERKKTCPKLLGGEVGIGGESVLGKT